MLQGISHPKFNHEMIHLLQTGSILLESDLQFLKNFEFLNLKQSFKSLLNVLICGMNALGAQWHSDIITVHRTSQDCNLAS